MSVAPYHLHLPVMCKPVGVLLQGCDTWVGLTFWKKGNFFCVSSSSKLSKEAMSSCLSNPLLLYECFLGMWYSFFSWLLTFDTIVTPHWHLLSVSFSHLTQVLVLKYTFTVFLRGSLSSSINTDTLVSHLLVQEGSTDIKELSATHSCWVLRDLSVLIHPSLILESAVGHISKYEGITTVWTPHTST